jgi:CYTH domain-containing protein
MPRADRAPEPGRAGTVSAKYAVLERERRWLVRRLPRLDRLTESRRVDDRYLEGTRLRLRRVTYPSGAREAEYKLGQKVRLDPSHPSVVMHTTIYLTEEEHARLSSLPGAELRKVRHTVRSGGEPFGLDVFEGRHRGLALIEIELRRGIEPEPPDFAGPEVTGQERFSGGWLAFATAGELDTLLRASGIVAGG